MIRSIFYHCISKTTENHPEQILFKFTSGLPIISQSFAFSNSFFAFLYFMLCSFKISE